MSVRHREDESARHGRRHAHHLNLVHARLGLAMLMAERAMLRIAASVRLLALLRHHARSSRWTLTEIRAGVSGNAELREEQRHRGQRADPPEPNPFHPERRRHTGRRIPDFDRRLNGKSTRALRTLSVVIGPPRSVMNTQAREESVIGCLFLWPPDSY